MKKLFYLIVLIAILGLIIPGCIPVVPPAEQNETSSLMKGSTIIVDDDGTPGVDCDYNTIQAAIDAADPGDTIFLKAGIYAEHLNISKSLSIIGELKDSVTIDASSFASGYGITVTADNIILKNFTLKGPPTHADGYER